jgi:hypothetical protein
MERPRILCIVSSKMSTWKGLLRGHNIDPTSKSDLHDDPFALGTLSDSLLIRVIGIWVIPQSTA